jgi:hypothetical protein
MTRIKRFSKRDWFDGIFNAVLFDTPADIRRRDIRRVQKKRKKSVRAYGNPRKPKATGTCYETAFQALFDGQHDEWTLVHGRPTLTCKPYIEYGHAWIEDPDGVTVFDTESRSYWPVEIYYKYGKIDPRKSNRYTKQQAAKWAVQLNHYGPWEGPDAVGSLHRKTRKNPPLLNKAWRTARAWVQRYGQRGALLRAQRMYHHHSTRGGRLMLKIMTRIMDENAIKPGPPVPKRPKPKRVVVTAKMYDRLLEEFGTSDAMGVRGFILENGECLNLGQYDDHRIINCVYTDSDAAEQKFGSRYGAFANLCRKFNMIRWMPEAKNCEVFVPTTRDQDRTIMDLADAGMLTEVEVHKPRGGTVMLEAEDGETLVRGINAILG